MKTLCLGLLAAALFGGMDSSAADRQFGFTEPQDGQRHFQIDGKPIQLVCGEMHYNRIPREYWRDRMKRARAMGLNTVSAYVFWSFHERKPGEFTFSGQADIREFVKIAGEEGLLVVLRPGPYVCAEYDFGGYPWWILLEQEKGMGYRKDDDKFIGLCARYLKALGEQLQDLQATRGGPIVMVQVENEYGSYGNDKVYLGKLRDAIRTAGFDVPLMTCDGGGQVPRGHLEGCLPTVNGVTDASLIDIVNRLQPGGPYFSAEFYPAWFDQWGDRHQTRNPETAGKQLDWMLGRGISVSLYMFHGGTNFEFTNGGNLHGAYRPQPTSYDYDAPLGEYGNITPKYLKFREIIAKRLGVEPPPVPEQPKTMAIPAFKLAGNPLGDWRPLSQWLPKPVASERPMSMESLGQAWGYLWYRTTVKEAAKGQLQLRQLRDYAVVMANGKVLGELDRRHAQEAIAVDLPAGATLELLVENVGRVNYGAALLDNHKGILGGVWIGDRELLGWENYSLPFDEAQVAGIRRQHDLMSSRLPPPPLPAQTPALVFTTFEVKGTPADTFLDLRGWGKGAIFVNGHSIGKFWTIGPQQTYYVPGCWLKPGLNDLLLLEISPRGADSVAFLDQPILDQLGKDINAGKKPLRIAKFPQLDDGDLACQGTLPEAPGPHRIQLPHPVTARHLCLQTLSTYGNDPFSALAELQVFDPEGKPIPRTAKWQILYADSEETAKENGSADNLVDGKENTAWHTEYSGDAPAKQPHTVVIDLGEIQNLGAIVLVQRRDPKVPGRVKEFKLYTRPQFFLDKP